jgi:hypothetical protein
MELQMRNYQTTLNTCLSYFQNRILSHSSFTNSTITQIAKENLKQIQNNNIKTILKVEVLNHSTIWWL